MERFGAGLAEAARSLSPSASQTSRLSVCLIVENEEELLGRCLWSVCGVARQVVVVDAGKENAGCNYVPRLVRDAPGVFFQGRIHEHAFGSVESRRTEWGLDNRLGAVRLLHHGYSKSVTQGRRKVERNLRLLTLALEESPGDPNLLLSHGLELVHSGAPDRVLPTAARLLGSALAEAQAA